jgi:hypothetical protein
MKSDTQKATLFERRDALLHQIEKWRKLQAVYMPGVIDASIPEPGTSPWEKVEHIKLWLPSHLDATEWDSFCSGGAITSKRELRFGQLDDALNC